jgi:hypothetical protein
LLQPLGVEHGARIAPGLARRAATLATQTSFAKATDLLTAEAGAAPSVRSLKRLVRDVGERCDLTSERTDLSSVPAMLADGTRLPAGPRYGPKAPLARGIELNIVCGVTGRDRSGRRPKARVELIGAAIGQPWSALEGSVRACSGAGIAVTDGDPGITSMLARAAPKGPHQHCTFHIHHNIRHRLWQDGVPHRERERVTERLLSPILDATSYRASLRALDDSIRFAQDNEWNLAAHHLRNVGPLLGTWHRVRRAKRPWRMPGRSCPEHTTSVLERTMREVNRRVDPPGNRWVVPGIRAVTNLLLAGRFDHPVWKDLWQDRGDTKVWAGLR